MLTIKEKSVVDQLREWKVATKKRLCHHLQISHMTVVRALKKFGYYTSYNRNSAFYTLHDIPEFDTHGLWGFRDIYFSRYATLDETIVALVETSNGGYTVGDLNNIVKTEIKNIVPRLYRKKRVNRYYLGRFVIYVSTDPDRESEQKRYRKAQLEKSQAAFRERQALPENLDAITIIKVLLQMIEFPQANDASISQTLQRQGVMITAKAVRSIIEFYSLQKKMEH